MGRAPYPARPGSTARWAIRVVARGLPIPVLSIWRPWMSVRSLPCSWVFTRSFASLFEVGCFRSVLAGDFCSGFPSGQELLVVVPSGLGGGGLLLLRTGG